MTCAAAPLRGMGCSGKTPCIHFMSPASRRRGKRCTWQSMSTAKRASGGARRRRASDGGGAGAHADRLPGAPADERGGGKRARRGAVLGLAEAADRIEREDPLAVLRDPLLVGVRGLD